MAFDYDVIIVGGGPAGMGAGISSANLNSKTLIIERNYKLGGILNQCIHNGFGLHYFKQELTGPEYADKFIKLIKKHKIDVLTNTFVTKVSENKVEIVNEFGAKVLTAKSIVLAMGCREKTAGSIKLNGSRPVGVYTAGQAQKLVNMYGKLPGKNVVILGSGDIGLIMARRLTYEGAKVKMVLEIMAKTSGLARNVRQCLEDNDIPLYYGTTITKVVGKNRIEGIYYAKVDDKLNPIKETEKYVKCDCLILSVGLASENNIIDDIKFNPITKSFDINEYRETSTKGVFACGNVLHVHDLVDNVTIESTLAGKYASLNASNKLNRNNPHNISCGDGIKYVLPTTYYEGEGTIDIYFRTSHKITKSNVVVTCNGEQIFSKYFLSMPSGEMQTFSINKQKLNGNLILCTLPMEVKK